MQEQSRKTKYIHRFYNSRARHWQFPLVFMALICLIVQPVYAASFDCKKAGTEMEKTICSDPKLSSLDENLAKLYGEIRKRLDDGEHVPTLKAFVESQRAWLAGLRQQKDGAIACTASKECLTSNYQKRLKELQSRLDLILKKAPSEELVMERLTNNLEQLKKMLQEAKDLKFDEPISGNNSIVCKQVLKNMAQAAVPKPTVFANKPEQKKEIFLKLREMAYYNQKLFFAQGNKVKDMKKYTENFEYAWNGPWTRGVEYDEKHNNSAFMFFARPVAPSGAKQPITVTVLLDSKEDGLSLSRDMLGPDGLWLHSLYSESAYSSEYWDENLSDQPQQYMLPPENAGIFAVGDDLVFWELRDYDWLTKNTWKLDIRPVRDQKEGKMIPCSFEFQMPSKQK